MGKVYFKQSEAIKSIIEVLESGYNGYLCDLHNEVFNTGYYIIGTCEAKQALEQYGVFDAIEEIKTYEQNNFGEVFTDFSEPEKVANMLWYIIGEGVTNGLPSEFDHLWNYEINEQYIPVILKHLRDNL